MTSPAAGSRACSYTHLHVVSTGHPSILPVQPTPTNINPLAGMAARPLSSTGVASPPRLHGHTIRAQPPEQGALG